ATAHLPFHRQAAAGKRGRDGCGGGGRSRRRRFGWIARNRQSQKGGAVMNDLLRELAPIAADAWKEIDDEARRTLKLGLAARKLVDFTGPLGWDASAVSLGRSEMLTDAP